MTIHFNAPQYCQNTENLQQEREALWEALNACDKETYQSVISLLEEAGLLHE